MKYFCISDVHGYYAEMLTALKQANFDRNNPEHILVVNGDIFDRGSQALEVFDYIYSLPKERRILIQGNHECIYLDLLNKDFPSPADFGNGTVGTFCQIAGVDPNEIDWHHQFIQKIIKEEDEDFDITQLLRDNWKKIREKVKTSSVTEWLKSDEWINYYEVDKFIITHSFIPVHIKDRDKKELAIYDADMANLSEFKNWRQKADDKDWFNAKWGCPWKEYQSGLFNNEIKHNKVLVCGHWHTADFHKNLANEEYDNYNLYYDNNLIALDACTPISKFCNVLIIDDADYSCYDKFGYKLGIHN